MVFLAAMAVLIFLYYRVVWGGVPGLVVALDHCRELYCDFVRQYYPTGRELLISGRPSNGYFYSSFFALLLVPLGHLDHGAAVSWWSVAQLIGVGLLLLPALNYYPRSRAAFSLYVVLLALSMPLLHNLKWGQVSSLVTGGVFAALFLYQRGRAGAAAVVLGLAVAIKYYVAVVAFYFLVRRDWRFLVVLAAAFSLFWLLIPTVVLGPEGNWSFYQTVRERVAHALATWMPEDINAQYMPSVVGRWLGTGAGRGVWRLLGYGVFLANLAAVARLIRRGIPRAAEWAVALLFLSLPFAIETSWPHYFVYLPFAQTLAWSELSNLPATERRRRWYLWLLLALSIILASMPFFQLVGRWQDYSRLGVLFVANLSLFILAHALTLRQPAAESDPPEPAALPST